MSLDSEATTRGENKFKYKFKGVLMETIFSRIRLPLIMALRCFSPLVLTHGSTSIICWT